MLWRLRTSIVICLASLSILILFAAHVRLGIELDDRNRLHRDVLLERTSIEDGRSDPLVPMSGRMEKCATHVCRPCEYAQACRRECDSCQFSHQVIYGNKNRVNSTTGTKFPVVSNCFQTTEPEKGMYKLPDVLCTPAYVTIGFPKTGSTSLWNYMMQHPRVRVYYKKEAHYFHNPPAFVQNPISWFAYLRGYPQISGSEVGNGDLLGDHTPGYVWRIPWNCRETTGQFGCANGPYPINTTMVNIRLTIPNAKLIVLVRDPVDRAYSHYHHFLDPEQCRAWGHPKKNPGCFHRHVEVELENLRECMARNGEGSKLCAWGPIGKDAWQNHRRVLSIGMYSVFLEEWLSYFPREQFCMLDLEDFKFGIDNGMQIIEDCLGLPHMGHYEGTPINRKSTKTGILPMLEETNKTLRIFYGPYNKRLCQLSLEPLGCEASWLLGYKASAMTDVTDSKNDNGTW